MFIILCFILNYSKAIRHHRHLILLMVANGNGIVAMQNCREFYSYMELHGNSRNLCFNIFFCRLVVPFPVLCYTILHMPYAMYTDVYCAVLCYIIYAVYQVDCAILYNISYILYHIYYILYTIPHMLYTMYTVLCYTKCILY